MGAGGVGEVRGEEGGWGEFGVCEGGVGEGLRGVGGGHWWWWLGFVDLELEVGLGGWGLRYR